MQTYKKLSGFASGEKTHLHWMPAGERRASALTAKSLFAEKFGVSERTVRNWCAEGKIEGAYIIGKTWSIPSDAIVPVKKSLSRKMSPLLAALREQKQSKLKGGIYHRTQIDLTYNSNHIEGSRLSHEQTR